MSKRKTGRKISGSSFTMLPSPIILQGLRQLIIFLCLFIMAGQAYAQTLKGLITDSISGKPLSPVVITNLRTNQSVYSDDDGQFSLHAQSGDKLALVFIGYRTLQWVMPPAIGAVRHHIEMQPLSYQLEELVVRTRNYTNYQIDSLERRDIYQRALSRERSGSVMSPVTLLAEKISKKSRQTFKFQKEFNYWEHQRFIDSRYSPELVNILTGLEGDTLADFMNTHPIPYDYVRAATDLELKMWIRTNYREFLRKQLTISDSLKTSK